MSLEDDLAKRLVLALAKEGAGIISECIQEVTYKHRTRNLYDSYGFGVYYEGRLKRMGYLSTSPNATETKRWYDKKLYGRTEIERFLKSTYKPKSKGMELVIAAAMPYGKVLENASSGQTQKYRVISMAYDKLQDLASQTGGYVTALTGGKI